MRDLEPARYISPVSSSVTTDQLSCPSDTTPLRNHFQCSQCSLWPSCNPLPAVTRSPSHPSTMFTLFTMVTWSPVFTLYTAASWALTLTLQRPPHQHHGTKICRPWLQCSADCSTTDLTSVSISCWTDCCLNLNGGGIDSPVSTDRHTTASGARLQAAVARCAGGYSDPGCSCGLVLRITSVFKTDRSSSFTVLNYSVQAGFISSMQRLAHCNFRIYRCAWQTTVTQAGAPTIQLPLSTAITRNE